MTDHHDSLHLPSRRLVLGGTGATAMGLVLAAISAADEAHAADYVRPVKDHVKHPITAAYKKPGNWAAGYHTGVDIGCPTGTPVYATIGGDVRTQSRANGGYAWGAAYGTMCILNDNVDGSDWGYCHLSKVVVAEGAAVKTGQLIGYSGNTGNTTGPHLHLERRPRYGRYGTDRNPNLWP